MRTIEYVSPAAIKPNPRNAHTHSKKQIEQIARSIDAFRFTAPVIIDETSMLLAGHGRFEAAKLRGLEEIPAIRLRGLSEARKRALMLADNKIAEHAGWDRERLAIELPELADLLIQENLDISITGFEAVEIDTLVSDFEERTADPADEIQTVRVRSVVGRGRNKHREFAMASGEMVPEKPLNRKGGGFGRQNHRVTFAGALSANRRLIMKLSC